jgi:hypothetical protein
VSVSIGGVAANILEARERNNQNSGSSEEVLNDDSESEHTPILSEDHKEVIVKFPTLALFTSLSITAIKFFYFGTALAAHDYLFSSKQTVTGDRYIQSKPWMHYSASWPLVKASIPSILIFDFGIPITFVVICWRFRNNFNSSSIQVYFGSLFETYTTRCFWWELVNTLKKLLIALVLKAFTSNDAIQSILVVTVLTGTQLVQLSVNPWRRKTENIADGAASGLLVAALLYTRPTNFLHASGVLWYIFMLSLAYLILSVGIIAWHTIYGTTDHERRLDALLTNYPDLAAKQEVTLDELLLEAENGQHALN